MTFVDTGAFLARSHPLDQYHAHARRAWKQIERSREPLATTNFVIDELLTLLARRVSYRAAAERGRIVYASRVLEILRPEADDEAEALGLFEKFADQSVSFTDAISFALMRRRRILRAFTFDRHFALAGFEVWP